MKVRHVPAIFPAENTTKGCCRTWNLVPSQCEHHTAYQVNHKITANSCPIFFPAAPACKTFCIEWNLRSIVKPGIPVKCSCGQISWRGIFPRTLRAVSYTHLRAHETDSYL